MVGRLDARFSGPVTSGELGYGESDPSMAAADSIFSSAMNRYFTDELGFQTDRPYVLLNTKVEEAWT